MSALERSPLQFAEPMSTIEAAERLDASTWQRSTGSSSAVGCAAARTRAGDVMVDAASVRAASAAYAAPPA